VELAMNTTDVGGVYNLLADILNGFDRFAPIYIYAADV
jgi:hypothetical protein